MALLPWRARQPGAPNPVGWIPVLSSPGASPAHGTRGRLGKAQRGRAEEGGGHPRRDRVGRFLLHCRPVAPAPISRPAVGTIDAATNDRGAPARDSAGSIVAPQLDPPPGRPTASLPLPPSCPCPTLPFRCQPCIAFGRNGPVCMSRWQRRCILRRQAQRRHQVVVCAHSG
jgi:hypothetical protein